MLGAFTDEYKLSDPVGHQMARLPLDPIYAKALILASQFNCLEEMLIAVAMLSVESIFYEPREKLDEVCACVLQTSIIFMHVDLDVCSSSMSFFLLMIKNITYFFLLDRQELQRNALQVMRETISL